VTPRSYTTTGGTIAQRGPSCALPRQASPIESRATKPNPGVQFSLSKRVQFRTPVDKYPSRATRDQRLAFGWRPSEAEGRRTPKPAAARPSRLRLGFVRGGDLVRGAPLYIARLGTLARVQRRLTSSHRRQLCGSRTGDHPITRRSEAGGCRRGVLGRSSGGTPLIGDQFVASDRWQNHQSPLPSSIVGAFD
jgi:hypothetical protein